MAHHKRKGPKSTRAGCLLCKPQKRQGAPEKDRRKFSDLRKIDGAKVAVEQVLKRSAARD